jgi:flagellar M-ring protein FliF
MNGLLLRLRTWWQVADRTQKLITVFGGGFLVVLLIGTFVFASRPKMELVFNNLSPEDTGSVSLEIENMGIPVTFDNNGNVFVPSDKRAQVRANLAMKGKLPKAGGAGSMDELKGLSPWSDPGIQKEQIKAITENQLAESIQVFDNVASANVQVTPATDSPFESERKPAQANVTIAEKPGGLITQEEARGMANLVASAVPGLDKNKVTIFTRSGRALWDGQDMDGPSASASNKLDMEKKESRKRRDELQTALNTMLGPGNAIAMVDLTLDVNKHSEETQNVDPSGKPIENASLSENMTLGAGAGNGLASGMAGQQPGAPQIGTGGSSPGNYTRTQTQPVYGTHTKAEHTDFAGGDIKSMAITVLVNKTDKINVNPADPNDPIVTLANSYLGPHKDDPNFPAAKVVAYPFDTSQADAAKKAEVAASSGNRMQQMMSFLPIVALLIVAFMIMKAIGKLASRPMPPMMAMAGGGPALPMPGDGSQMSSYMHGQQQALSPANRFVLPEIVKQKALEAGISEEQLQAAIEEAGDAGISLDDIPSIKSKVNVPLEQIKKMAGERPEAVAMLIKSWLIEEGIRR